MKFQTIILQKKRDNKMQERPILFQTEMVRAILSGQKTQTRRVIKSQPQKNGGKGVHPVEPYRCPNGQWNWVLSATGHGVQDPFNCPYGAVGDELWVRETHAILRMQAGHEYPDDVEIIVPNKTPKTDEGGYWKSIYRQEWEFGFRFGYKETTYDRGFKWRPSIFMPRWASRIQLKITNVRVERLNDISEDDAYAEGVEWDDGGDLPDGRDSGGGFLDYQNEERWDLSAHESFKSLWQKINGKKIPWDENPWVWVIEFEVVKP